MNNKVIVIEWCQEACANIGPISGFYLFYDIIKIKDIYGK
jgi:hypothetical protein